MNHEQISVDIALSKVCGRKYWKWGNCLEQFKKKLDCQVTYTNMCSGCIWWRLVTSSVSPTNENLMKYEYFSEYLLENATEYFERLVKLSSKTNTGQTAFKNRSNYTYFLCDGECMCVLSLFRRNYCFWESLMLLFCLSAGCWLLCLVPSTSWQWEVSRPQPSPSAGAHFYAK